MIKKVLIIDDEPDIVNMLEETLKIFFDAILEEIKDKNNDFKIEILTAEDGEEGIKLFEENKDKIFFIVCDGHMPKKNGIDVGRHVAGHPCVKILYTATADAFSEEDKKLFQKIINKPSQLTEFEKVVRGSLILLHPKLIMHPPRQ